MSIYDFTVKDAVFHQVPMAEYKGKVLLIVNTATGCGFTPQYQGLQELYAKYNARGFEVLDFPCNQFMNQAPGTEQEIVSFCQGRFGVKFKTFAKIDVNGKNADPLFQYLRSETKGKLGDKVKWNFTKFLVDKNGRVVARYAPTTEPAAIEQDIADLLEEG